MFWLSSNKVTILLLQFDITFHKMPCAWTSLDAMDISGEMHLDVVSLTTLGSDMMYSCTDTEHRHFAKKPTSSSMSRKQFQTFCRTTMSTRSGYRQMAHQLMRASSTQLGQRTLTSCPKTMSMKMELLAAVVMVLKLLHNRVVIPVMR